MRDHLHGESSFWTSGWCDGWNADSCWCRRFRLILDWFETGPSGFSRHFNALPPSEREEWQTRLEKVAYRRVVVWDPRFPDAEMPRHEAEDAREWLPQKSPDEPRRYVEHLGDGKAAIGFETHWGVESRKRREAMRRQRQEKSAGKETTRTTNGVVRLNGGSTK